VHRDAQQVIATSSRAWAPAMELYSMSPYDLLAGKLDRDADQTARTFTRQIARNAAESWQQVAYPQATLPAPTAAGLGTRNASHHNCSAMSVQTSKLRCCPSPIARRTTACVADGSSAP
jgi:hypothetical protein